MRSLCPRTQPHLTREARAASSFGGEINGLDAEAAADLAADKAPQAAGSGGSTRGGSGSGCEGEGDGGAANVEAETPRTAK